MRGLKFETGGALEILFLGAHCDDIEIGCGATVLQIAEAHPNATVHWVVLSSNDEREAEARASASRFLAGISNVNVIVERFRNSYFPSIASEIKGFFEMLKLDVSPDVIFTHYSKDLHQDHRITAELTWNTWRDHLICEYEIPKYDGGLGSPNMFSQLSEEKLQQKSGILLAEFATQRTKSWFTEDTFRGLARLRGIECNSPSGFAEAFYCRKSLIAI